MFNQEFYFKQVVILITFIVVVNSSVGQGRVSQRLGDYASHEVTSNQVLIKTSFGLAKISALQEDVIHVIIVKDEFRSKANYAVIQDATIPFKSINENTNELILETERLTVKVNKAPLTLTYLNKKGNVLSEDDEMGIRWIGNQVTNYKKLVSDEKFVGLGEKTGPLNRRGQAYENWNNDDYAYEVDDDPIYASVPFYIGIHSKLTYGIFLNNTFKTVFNFGASNDRFSSFGAEDGELDYYFFGGSSVRDIVKDYTWLTGRMELPPIWSLGFQQSRWSYFPDKEVLTLARTFREKEIPADVIYLDIHYMDQYKIFTWDNKRFSDPKGTIKQLNDMGFHVAVIVDPGIKTEDGYQVYEDGVEKKVFATYPDGSNYAARVWPGRCFFPDFTLDKSRKWWGNKFNTLTDVGVEGFWNDMNEPASWGNRTPDLVEFGMEGNRGTHLEAHNVYGMQMSRATFEGVNQLRNNKRSFILTRAAFSGSQRYSAVWTGDNVASDDHMLLSARMVASMGLSGISFAGPDVGGFVGDRTPELFARWLSQGAFTPFFRNHSSHNTRDHEPWAYGEQIEGISRKYLNTRYQLLPYVYASFYESSISGIPVARSLVMDYTFDNKVYTRAYHNQYLFGPNLLIAPVESDQKFAKVYLPEGKWTHYWTNKVFEGNQELIVDAPLDQLPIFVREGAIIPMQSTIQHANQKPSDKLMIHVYDGSQKTSFEYYEDDGNTFDYQDGAFYKRAISYDPEGQLTLGKVEGNYVSKFLSAEIVFHSNGKFDIIATIPFDKSEQKVSLPRSKK
ncbi:glycoside hydrolase family 31 protein [Ekhidna sp.]